MRGRALAGGAVVIVAAVAVAALAARPDRVASVPGGSELALPDPRSVYDPVRAGEELPAGFIQVIPRDIIAPVYDPRFVPAGESGWDGQTQVIGVEVDGEARAYPVGFLNRREMVIDRVAGIPILVTW